MPISISSLLEEEDQKEAVVNPVTSEGVSPLEEMSIERDAGIGIPISSLLGGPIPTENKTKGEVFAPRISRVSGIKGFEGESRTDSVVTNLGLDAKEMVKAYGILFDAMMEDPAGTAKAVATNFGPAMVESYTRWAEAWKQGVFLDAVKEHPLQAAQDLALPFLAISGVGAVGTAAGVVSRGGKLSKSLAKAAKVADRVNAALDPVGTGAFLAGRVAGKAALAPVAKKIKPPPAKSSTQAMNISVDPAVEAVPFKDKAAAMARSAKQNMIDRFYPIRELGQRFEAIKRDLPVSKSKEFVDSPLEQKSRLYSGFDEKVADALRTGVPDPNALGKKLTRIDGSASDKGLADIFNGLDPELWNALRDYGVSKRAIDLEARGINSGQNLDSARQIIESIEETTTPEALAIQKTWGEWRQFSDDLLEYYQQGGMISKETADNFRAANPNYVPFFRDLGGEGAGEAGKFKLHKIKGSDKPVKDPMESSLILTGQMMRNVEMNQIARELLPMADQPGTGVRLRKADDAFKVGDEVDLEKTLEGADMQAKELPRNGIEFYKDGQKVILELDDPMVLQAFSALRAAGDNKIADFFGSSKLLAIPRGLAQLKRAGITLSPGFTLGLNLIRDTMSASVNTQFGFKPVYSNLRGAMAYLKKGELYDLWAASGGMQAELSALDRPELRKRLTKYLGENKVYLSGIKNYILQPIELLRAFQRLSEGATRMGEFEAGIRQGLKQQAGETVQQAMERARAEGIDVDAAIRKAAVSSRDVSTDFGIKPGNTFIRSWNMMAPFQNAQIQSLDLVRRRMYNSSASQKAAYAARAGLFITLPSIMMQGWLMNDEEYQDQVPQFEKDLFWHIRMPEASPILPGALARVPKPFEIGLMFGSLPERTLQSIAQQDPTVMLNLTDRIVEDFQPFQFPTALGLPLEIYTDRDFFFDAPLTPGSQKRFRKSEQALPSTSQLSRVLSKWTEYMAEGLPRKQNIPAEAILSPIQIEKLITGATGSIGKGLLDLSDPIIASRDIIKPEAKGPEIGGIKAKYIPIVNRLLSNPSKRSQVRADFYEMLGAHERILNSLSDPRLPESDKKNLLGDFETIHRAKRLRRFAKKINALVKRQRQIEFSRVIRSGKEKRRLIDVLDGRINRIAAEALRGIRKPRETNFQFTNFPIE